MATFDETKKLLEILEIETNEKIVGILNDCEEEVGIQSTNYLIQREHQNTAWPIQLDLIRWKAIYPKGVSRDVKRINRVHGAKNG